jgi:hypothetical protein
MSQATENQKTQFAWTLLGALILAAVVLSLLAWVGPGRSPGWTTPKALTEITQLATAINNFKARYGVYPPSRIKLCRNWKDYDLAKPLDRDSVQLLTRLFPRISARVLSSQMAGPGDPQTLTILTALVGMI